MLRRPQISTLFPYTTLFRSVGDECSEEWPAGEFSEGTRDFDGGAMVDERAVQRNGYADYGAAEIVDAMAGVAIGGSGGRRRSRLAEGIGGRAWRREARTFFERTELRAACGVLCGLRSVCVAE